MQHGTFCDLNKIKTELEFQFRLFEINIWRGKVVGMKVRVIISTPLNFVWNKYNFSLGEFCVTLVT